MRRDEYRGFIEFDSGTDDKSSKFQVFSKRIHPAKISLSRVPGNGGTRTTSGEGPKELAIKYMCMDAFTKSSGP
ncbi:unnamed protein product [Lasius platythorax]|uniref:Uncharacterized protein n=1 Tax=Lasius platythorax TaxID=488582 RepID=A0AAV2N364_9HYME